MDHPVAIKVSQSVSNSSLELAAGVSVGALELLVRARHERRGDGDAGHEGDQELHLAEADNSAG